MANTFTQIYLQFIFAVENRISFIMPEWKDTLYKYITCIVQNNKHRMIVINGTCNHIHIFVGYKPHQLIPDLLQDIKGDSSKLVNDKRLVYGKFQWHEGYGAFSYSHSHIDRVVRYIKGQEAHHKQKRFNEEYLKILNKFDIKHDVKSIHLAENRPESSRGTPCLFFIYSSFSRYPLLNSRGSDSVFLIFPQKTPLLW